MIEFVREVRYINMFCFILHGQDMRWDESTRVLLQIFEDNFGKEFWKNVSIIYTNWPNDPISIKKRERQKLTE